MQCVTVARAKDLELAVPELKGGKSSQTLIQIAQGWKDWPSKGARSFERACNVEYRDGPDGVCVSMLVEGGVVWATPLYGTWPSFIVTKRGEALIVPNTNIPLAREAKFGFSAGPRLVKNGQICNLAAEIKIGPYFGLQESVPRQRAAIGITADGLIVHVAVDKATLDEVATIMRQHGAVDAIALDGGGSVGVIDGSGKILLGSSERKVCSALIFKETLNSVAQAKAGTRATVCLDPGHGGRDRSNRGPTGYVEADGALDMALVAGMVLRSHGYEVVFTRDTDRDLAGKTFTQSGDLGGRVYISNKSGAEAFVSIHTNAGGGRGTETWCYRGSVKGRRLAELVQRAIVDELCFADRGVKEGDFYVLRKTIAPACLVEVAFHDNPQEERLLKQPAIRARAGFAIAKGIMNYFKEG